MDLGTWISIGISLAALCVALFFPIRSWYRERFAPYLVTWTPFHTRAKVGLAEWVLKAQIRNHTSDRALFIFSAHLYRVDEDPTAVADVSWEPHAWPAMLVIQGSLSVPPGESREIAWTLTAHKAGVHPIRLAFDELHRVKKVPQFGYDIAFVAE